MIISKTKAASLALDPGMVRAIPSFLPIHETAKSKLTGSDCGSCSSSEVAGQAEVIAEAVMSFLKKLSVEEKKALQEYLKAPDIYIYTRNEKGGIQLGLL
jgi:hypothetical protein